MTADTRQRAREPLHATVNERTALCDGRAIVPRAQMTDEQWRTWRCCPSCVAVVEHLREERFQRRGHVQ